MMNPSPTDANGRDASGRFAAGNHAGRGNPYAKRVQELRTVLLSAVSDDDLRAVVVRLVEAAKSGDVAAAREVLDRCLGKSLAMVDVAVAEQESYENRQARLAAIAARLDREARSGELDELARNLGCHINSPESLNASEAE